MFFELIGFFSFSTLLIFDLIAQFTLDFSTILIFDLIAQFTLDFSTILVFELIDFRPYCLLPRKKCISSGTKSPWRFFLLLRCFFGSKTFLLKTDFCNLQRLRPSKGEKNLWKIRLDQWFSTSGTRKEAKHVLDTLQSVS